ncbi:MAG: sigma-54-dependent Fis family transcriptional regulator [Kofleriaceae bacterium]|nr:sigma-54-dependent Fis family transcriptional regulator [Kofleriaceae bacterium]
MAAADVIAELLAAIASADTPKSLVRGIASALSRHAPIQAVVLGDETPMPKISIGAASRESGDEVSSPIAVAEQIDGEWRIVERASRPTSPIVPGLAVATRGALPAVLRDLALRAALAPAIELALNHVRVVRRVADLSRQAHSRARELSAEIGMVGLQPTLVTRSPAMRAVAERVAAVARHATTVLVIGESGTGKERIATEIHDQSMRRHRPFVALNCGAIPESLIESELFGHERGAFTGAERTRAGAFERAHRGTLLLDEIGELSAAAQVKLLRVLQERRVRRVGGAAEIEVDVRVIAATNRRLDDMVREGAFREDLFYRLAVFEIVVPPLRERVDDIAPLADAILEAHARRLGLVKPQLTRAIVGRLEAHAWPGNVRELENVLEAALIVGDGKLELPAELGRGAGSRRAGLDFASASRAAIEAALRACRGKIYGTDGAAARLGLEPSTLQSKMKRLGIERGTFTRRAGG